MFQWINGTSKLMVLHEVQYCTLMCSEPIICLGLDEEVGKTNIIFFKEDYVFYNKSSR